MLAHGAGFHSTQSGSRERCPGASRLLRTTQYDTRFMDTVLSRSVVISACERSPDSFRQHPTSWPQSAACPVRSAGHQHVHVYKLKGERVHWRCRMGLALGLCSRCAGWPSCADQGTACTGRTHCGNGRSGSAVVMRSWSDSPLCGVQLSLALLARPLPRAVALLHEQRRRRAE